MKFILFKGVYEGMAAHWTKGLSNREINGPGHQTPTVIGQNLWSLASGKIWMDRRENLKKNFGILLIEREEFRG
jgi:hypothetical protein